MDNHSIIAVKVGLLNCLLGLSQALVSRLMTQQTPSMKIQLRGSGSGLDSGGSECGSGSDSDSGSRGDHGTDSGGSNSNGSSSRGMDSGSGKLGAKDTMSAGELEHDPSHASDHGKEPDTIAKESSSEEELKVGTIKEASMMAHISL